MLSNSAIYVCLLFSGQSFGNRISLLLIIIQHNEVRTTDRELVFIRKLMKSSLNTNRVIAADWTCCRRYGNTRKFKEIYKLYWRMILVGGSEKILWMRCITFLLRLRLCSYIYSCFTFSYQNCMSFEFHLWMDLYLWISWTILLLWLYLGSWSYIVFYSDLNFFV